MIREHDDQVCSVNTLGAAQHAKYGFVDRLGIASAAGFGRSGW
jgi:hypothetical protein